MKAKLIKDEVGFNLCIPNGSTNEFIASTDGMYVKYKLSLKNCESIERGYDLDELADGAFDSMGYHSTVTPHEEKQFRLGYKLGLQKALELIGDKKFSEEDVLKAIEMYYEKKKIFIEIIQSLQKTEWDVEIKMRSKDIDELRESGEGFLNNKNLHVMELDEQGCLILKKA